MSGADLGPGPRYGTLVRVGRVLGERVVEGAESFDQLITRGVIDYGAQDDLLRGVSGAQRTRSLEHPVNAGLRGVQDLRDLALGLAVLLQLVRVAHLLDEVQPLLGLTNQCLVGDVFDSGDHGVPPLVSDTYRITA